MKLKYYILDERGEPKGATLVEWMFWFKEHNDDRKVAKERIGDSEVSTVFLGINHNFLDKGPAVLWETMVFGGPLDQEQDRCSGSREQALAMHNKMVNKVKDKMKGQTNGR